MKKAMYVLELLCNEKVTNYDVRSSSWQNMYRVNYITKTILKIKRV